MLRYLSLDIICSLKLKVYLKLCSCKTVRFSEQIMSADKYSSIFSSQIVAIVYRFDRLACGLVTFYQWGHFVMIIIWNLNFISIQSWTYLGRPHYHMLELVLNCHSKQQALWHNGKQCSLVVMLTNHFLHSYSASHGGFLSQQCCACTCMIIKMNNKQRPETLTTTRVFKMFWSRRPTLEK